jgi:hypothetical protein
MPKPAGVVGVAGATGTLRVAVVGPEPLPAVRLTVNVPAAVYVWLGCWSELVPPSPKDQDHDVGFPVLASVNCTAWFDVGAEGDSANAAAGAEPTGAVADDDPSPPHAANTRAPNSSPDGKARRV